MTGKMQYNKATLNEWLLRVSALLLACNALTGWLHREKVTWRQQRTVEPWWLALNLSVYHVLTVLAGDYTD